jgi:hypothetical protein
LPILGLKELKQERDEEVRRLDEFLGKLRYGNYEL